jgi:transcription-repair coupling factor (superfamily II helicase)
VATESSTEVGSTHLLAKLMAGHEMERLASVIGKPNLSRVPRGRTAVVSGLAGSARGLFLAALGKKTGRTILYVGRSNREIEDFRSDIEFFHSALNPGNSEQSLAAPVMMVPASEGDPYDGASPHAEILEQRALALYAASAAPAHDGPGSQIFLTSLRALAERTASPQSLRASGISLKVGDEMPLELIVDMLISTGYVREEPVAAVGDFSMRGGILDVFSPAHDMPHRIEFFGDAVESIREFDIDTQRSTGRATESVIAPMREVAVRREEFMEWAKAAGERWSDEVFRRDLRLRLAHAERGEPFPGWEYLLPLTRPDNASVLDYFKDAILVIDEPSDIEKSARELFEYLATRFAQASDAGELALEPERLYFACDELRNRFETLDRVELRLLGRAAAATDEQFRIESLALPETIDIGERRAGPTDATEGNYGPEPAASGSAANGTIQTQGIFLFPVVGEGVDVELISQAPRRYHGRVQDLSSDLQGEWSGADAFLFVMPSLGVAERVRDMLAEYGIAAELQPTLARSEHKAHSPTTGQKTIVVTVGKLMNGFTLPAADISVLVVGDVFGDVERIDRQRAAPKRVRKQRSIEAFLSDLGDLKVGDYVVHVDHGIGQFQGLMPIPVSAGTGPGPFNVAEGIGRGSNTREFMLITYAEGARLYVPVERLDLIQRFSAAEGAKPNLDRLGGVGWQKTKARAKRAMQDMAEELLKLYAERKLAGGYAYAADSPWQSEFEDAFEYPLTPDQETSVDDIKADMEKTQPMDRLIVGDVGYGKTEVAMRAAFKAVMEGKQAAVLAPTTVLAYQHHETFKRRFSAFPVRIDMISRFRSAKAQKEVVKAVESGTVDIVIGTHRLLSKDVRFKDLGLLVVDEEQRFGVAHKERIKQMRKKVDVIAMSATPIPRTLNMSMAGLRDISVIETPPRDRLAIQTQVVQFSEPILRSAVELEMQRGGQVFFVHNRVETIDSIAELIHRLVPTARIGVGHGQMDEKRLEEVMLKFTRHDLDILVCTTIIENGIDIPLANTIIINRADAYGLSQLYQLRGRVGRSSRRAYAYLLIPSEEGLTQIARRRLAAIREFSDLGAGFRIAALDLELRGAGNLLGREQSGHIDAIGFDMYTRMLERAVREMKGDPIEEESSTTINLGIDIRIPQDYIYDMSQRLRVYKRVSSTDREEDLADIHGEIEDRYGPIPPTVENLFEYARLRKEAASLGIVSIDREAERLSVKFLESARVDPDKLIAIVSARPSRSFTRAGVLKVELSDQEDATVFGEVKALLSSLR